MNSRVYSKRKPVKRLQLLPGDLPSKYPACLRPSPVLVRCCKISLAAETTALALTAWLRQRIRMGRLAINDGLLRLTLRERMRRYGVALIGGLSWGFRTLQHGLINLGYVGLRMSRIGSHAIVSWIRSQPMGSREKNRSAWDYPLLRLEAYSSESSVRQKLTRSHAQLVEELLVEEEELTRLSTRVVRLQRLIRAEEQLLVELTPNNEGLFEDSRLFDEAADNLVAVGNTSGLDKSQDRPRFRRP